MTTDFLYVSYHMTNHMTSGDTEARQDPQSRSHTIYGRRSLTRNGIRVEVALKDLILADYGKKNK